MAAADELLAAELGVHTGLVGDLRRDQLVEGVDWYRVVDSGRVIYTESGISKVMGLLGTPEKNAGGGAAAAPSASQAGPEGDDSGPPVRERLRIVRLMPNPLWVALANPEGGGVAEVRVQRREGLRLGHLLLCELQADGQWQCVQNPHACAMPKKEGGPV